MHYSSKIENPQSLTRQKSDFDKQIFHGKQNEIYFRHSSSGFVLFATVTNKPYLR